MLLKKKHQVVNGLMQSGYKAIRCEEDPYLRQLVGYIHLNPLRAGIVDDVAALKDYPFIGYRTHASLLLSAMRHKSSSCAEPMCANLPELKRSSPKKIFCASTQLCSNSPRLYPVEQVSHQMLRPLGAATMPMSIFQPACEACQKT